DDLIRFNLKNYFSIFDYESLSAHMIKITRDAELDMEENWSQSYTQKLMQSVRSREEGQTVRFVYDEEIEEDTLKFLLTRLGIESNDSLIPGGKYHNRKDYMRFPQLAAGDLLYPKLEPLPIAGLEMEGSLLKQM